MAVKLKLVGLGDGDVVRVAAEGDVVAAGSGAGANPLADLLGDGWKAKRVLLDFARAGYIDSAGIGFLIGSARHLEQGGGRLVIHSVVPRIRQMLDMLKVDKVVPIAKDEAEGRALLDKPPAAAAASPAAVKPDPAATAKGA